MRARTTMRAARLRVGWLRQSQGGSAGSTAVLVLLLTIWLLEPLACTTYYRNWTLRQLHSALIAQHQDQDSPDDATALDETTSELAHLRPVVFSNLSVSFIDPIHGNPVDGPSAPSPTFSHSHLAIALVTSLLMLMFSIQKYRVAAPSCSPQRAFIPFLRPPIAVEI